jgi:hypothetical protein
MCWESWSWSLPSSRSQVWRLIEISHYSGWNHSTQCRWMSKKRDLLQTTHAHTPESPCWCWEQQDETRQIGSTGGKHQKSSGDSMGSPSRSCLALGKLSILVGP